MFDKKICGDSGTFMTDHSYLFCKTNKNYYFAVCRMAFEPNFIVCSCFRCKVAIASQGLQNPWLDCQLKHIIHQAYQASAVEISVTEMTLRPEQPGKQVTQGWCKGHIFTVLCTVISCLARRQHLVSPIIKSNFRCLRNWHLNV